MPKWTRDSNCYGYATNTPKWLLLDDRNYREKAVNTLLCANPTWKLVSRKDMVLGKEYVAFRYCSTDYHFMKRNKDGFWRHKMGAQPVQAVSTKFVFGKSWDVGHRTYNSKLYLFETM